MYIVSHLSDELERQLTAKNLSVDDLAERSGISRGQIYLWRRGEQTSINQEQLRAIATNLTQDPLHHAALVRAHLLDERFGPGSELVQIELLTPAELKDAPKPRSKGEHSLKFLADLRVKSRDVNELVIDLARCLGAKL